MFAFIQMCCGCASCEQTCHNPNKTTGTSHSRGKLAFGVKLNLSKMGSTTNTHAHMHIHNHLSKGQQKTGQTEIPSKCSTNFETELNAFRGV